MAKQNGEKIAAIVTACVVGVMLVTSGLATHDTHSTARSVAAVSESTVLSDSLKKVQLRFKAIESKQDKMLIYTLFAGSAKYLLECQELVGTQQFDPILGRVQSSYGWSRDKYPEFTDAVSEYLVGVGYDKPKPLDSKSARFEFAQIFQGLAEATKHE